MDAKLKAELETIKEMVLDDWDGIIYIGGMEGAGKSVLTQQIAKELDPSFCLKRCVFTGQQFLKQVDEAKQRQVILWDEAQDAFESTRKDKAAMAIKNVLTRIRSKNLYILIVAPHFWMINEYLFCSRSRAFIRVTARGKQRGWFEFYGMEAKLRLYTIARKYKDLARVRPNFIGRFPAGWVLDTKEYNEKKDAAMLEEEMIDKRIQQRNRAIQLLSMYMNDGVIGDELGLSRVQINHIRNSPPPLNNG